MKRLNKIFIQSAHSRKEKHFCVQCGEDMVCEYGVVKVAFYFCNRAKCPNYSMLQTGILPINKKIK